MKCPFKIKVCTKCKRILVAYEGNFYKAKECKYDLRNVCKKCESERSKEYYRKNDNHIKEKAKKYREDNKEYCKEYKKQYYEENKEEISEKYKKYQEDNKEKIKEYKKQYYEKNKKEILEKCKQYREENKEEIKKRKRKYREENKEKIAESNKRWQKENPEKVFNRAQKRRLLEESQGSGVTKEQWLEMMYYFDFKCAYSGVYIGGNSEHRTIDHIVPLSKGGLNEIWNLVPMYSNYNSSKSTSNMEVWYMEQEFFDIDRLLRIYEWIEYAYNKWGMK